MFEICFDINFYSNVKINATRMFLLKSIALSLSRTTDMFMYTYVAVLSLKICMSLRIKHAVFCDYVLR